ncbi:hypothetical protein [Lichenicoccus sp.]|uniref:hypothetical protein n=1 Tax=Lichenicoccus sp. TaxID=2781899 RepID=UPI003D0F739F
MRMMLVFTVFAAISAVLWALMPHIAGAVALDMMLIYLLLAVISALLALLPQGSSSDG